MLRGVGVLFWLNVAEFWGFWGFFGVGWGAVPLPPPLTSVCLLGGEDSGINLDLQLSLHLLPLGLGWFPWEPSPSARGREGGRGGFLFLKLFKEEGGWGGGLRDARGLCTAAGRTKRPTTAPQPGSHRSKVTHDPGAPLLTWLSGEDAVRTSSSV